MSRRINNQVNKKNTVLKDFMEWYIDIKKFMPKVNEITQSVDISFDQYIILAKLYRNPGLTTSTISELLQTSSAATSRKISLLYTKKMIEKSHYESKDQRRVSLSLTPKGITTLNEFEDSLYHYLEKQELVKPILEDCNVKKVKNYYNVDSFDGTVITSKGFSR